MELAVVTGEQNYLSTFSVSSLFVWTFEAFRSSVAFVPSTGRTHGHKFRHTTHFVAVLPSAVSLLQVTQKGNSQF